MSSKDGNPVAVAELLENMKQRTSERGSVFIQELIHEHIRTHLNI